MSVQKAYDQWSLTYDAVENKTRDLEAKACRVTLDSIEFTEVIELGGGTGKNTPYLATRAERVLSVDLSPEMQAVARTKFATGNIEFRIADVKEKWTFGDTKADLITCSLILEHIEDLGHVFEQAALHLRPGGRFYICELHPFKQYSGSKARFETDTGTHLVECYIHNVSDYTQAAAEHGFVIERLDEWFDDNDRTNVPRLLSFVFRFDR